MPLDTFLQTTLKLAIPGFYISAIIMLVLHFRLKVKGKPTPSLRVMGLRLILFTVAATLVLSLVVFFFLGVLSLSDSPA